MIKKISYFILLSIILSCSESDDNLQPDLIEQVENVLTLQNYIQDRDIELEAVIGCAGSADMNSAILAFYYNEEGSSEHRFYETENIDVANDDFSNYTQIDLKSVPLFNGALGMFTRTSENEKWIILTYELGNEIKISNPIRSKQNTQPTIYSEIVNIDQGQPTSTMPIFSWRDNPFGGNAIYFQIVSDSENNLLSGTYTFGNQFQYYDVSNVVLNITRGTPPNLNLKINYNFTLMDVSEDSWVNFLTLNQNFILE